MKVIFLKDVSGGARMYDIKDVSDGHALNYLIPNHIAERATPALIAKIEKEKQDKEERRRQEEQVLISKLSSIENTITLKYKVNEKGHLFSSIHQKEVLHALNSVIGIKSGGQGLKLSEADIVMSKPIKELGEHYVDIKIGDKKQNLKVLVERE